MRDMTGLRFGRLTTITIYKRGGAHKPNVWLCRCDCGNEKAINGSNLRQGFVHSCGCLRKEELRERSTKHGHKSRTAKHPLYQTWANARERVNNPKNPGYKNYGGRGITMCAAWNHSEGFPQFLADMGERPPGLTIERIDNDGPYAPWNCKWATRKEQVANQRARRRVRTDDQRQLSPTTS